MNGEQFLKEVKEIKDLANKQKTHNYGTASDALFALHLVERLCGLLLDTFDSPNPSGPGNFQRKSGEPEQPIERDTFDH